MYLANNKKPKIDNVAISPECYLCHRKIVEHFTIDNILSNIGRSTSVRINKKSQPFWRCYPAYCNVYLTMSENRFGEKQSNSLKRLTLSFIDSHRIVDL